MSMDKAKWYYICYVPFNGVDELIDQFYKLLLHYQMINEIGLKRTYYKDTESNYIWFFCGQKKLNKIIEEAHLLGLEDELLIFERKRKGGKE